MAHTIKPPSVRGGFLFGIYYLICLEDGLGLTQVESRLRGRFRPSLRKSLEVARFYPWAAKPIRSVLNVYLHSVPL